MRFASTLLLVLALLPASLVRAQVPEPAAEEPPSVHFRVVIEAPRPYRKLLQEGLDLVRWQRDGRVTMPLLQRLVAEARKAAAEALAADGYFSANVQSRIDTTAKSEAVVHLAVAPGPRTRVRKVDIAVEGTAE